jgi:2-iminobutanoate/2-iminopropanoate deaminase
MTMKYAFLGALLLGALALALRPDDEAVRRIVREELAAPIEKQYFRPTNTIGPYTPAVRAGRFLFVSGQIALDPVSGQMRNESLEVETRQVLANLAGVLRDAGYDSSHVVNATVYLKDMKNYAAVNALYARFFPEGRYPARVAVEVAALPKQANVEIAVIAVR